MKQEQSKTQCISKNKIKERFVTIILFLYHQAKKLKNSGILSRFSLAFFLSAIALSVLGYLQTQDGSMRNLFLSTGSLLTGIWVGYTIGKNTKKSFFFTAIIIVVYFLSFFCALSSLNNLLELYLLRQPYTYVSFGVNLLLFIPSFTLFLDLLYRLLKFVFQKINMFFSRLLGDSPSKSMTVFHNLISTLLTIATLISTVFSLIGFRQW